MSQRSIIAACLAVMTIIYPMSAEAKRDPQRKWLSKKPLIGKIEVIGNEYFDDGAIKGAIRSKENGFWQSLRLRKRHRLKKDSREVDLAALSYLYSTGGFLDVQIDEEFVVAEDSSATVRITIEEGRQYIVRSCTTPDEIGSFEEKVSHQLRQIKRGEPLDPYNVEQVKFNIKTVYANSGFPYAEVRDSTVLYDGTDSVDVIFRVDRGPLTVFGDIEIDSLTFTKRHTFVRELLVKPGDLYSREKIVESRQRVYSTGLVSYVDLALKNPRSDGEQGLYDVRPSFILKVRERMPKFAKVKAGAGQDIEERDLVWNLGFEFGGRNISGRGRGVKFEMSSKFSAFPEDWRLLDGRFALEYREPWLFKIRMPFYVTFAFSPGIRREYAMKADTVGQTEDIETREYIVSTIDLGLRTSKQLTRFMSSQAEIVYQKVSIPGISDATLDTLKQAGEISVKRKLVLRLNRDTRNNLLLPIRGTVFRAGLEYVGGFLGGDDDFVKLTANWSRYQNFYGSNVYAWNYRIGWVVGTASDRRVPVTDRFVLGGGRSIRGYTSLNIAAIGAEVARGRVLIQTNHEIRRPLVWKFWASTFLDIGNIYEDFKYIRWDNLLVTGGVGLQYVSPVGPIRLDYGHRLIRGGYDKGGRFHVSILYAF